MALQQQRERTIEQPKPESALAALWREVVVENPVYRKESLIAIPINANLPEHKQLEQREAARRKRTDWEALSLPQKLWKKTFPLLLVFAVAYTLVPVLALWLKSGVGGIASGFWGVLMGGLSASTAIVSEREKRTWNALLLSGLTARQILGGKLLFYLQQTLGVLLGVFVVAVAVVLRGHLPAVALLLIVPILASHLLTTLLALRISLWSTSVRQASRKALWCVLLVIPLLVSVLLAALALLGRVWGGFLLLPFAYAAIALSVSVALWRRMQRELWSAPKDFSG
jgi:hypothetical protein